MSLRSRLLPGITAALAAPALLRAQAPPQARDTAHVLPVVTTATRVAVPQRDVPASVTVITRDQLRALGITTVADAMAATPSAIVAQSGSFGGATSLFLRGGESDYVKVLVDGVPLNDPGGAFDFSTLTTDDVDRIEIVRGPASVLYGADAVSGVVQIFTRRGTTGQHLTVAARGGTYHTGDASVTVLGGTAPSGDSHADYSLSVARHVTAGIYPFNNRFAESVVSGLAGFDPDASDSLRLTLRYTDSRYDYPTNSGGEVVDSNQYDAGDRIVLGAAYGHEFSRVAALTVHLASDETDGGTTQRPDTLGGDQYLSIDDIRRHSADAELDLRDPAGRGVLTLGASASAADENSQSQSVSGGYPFESQFAAYRRTDAGYAQLLYTGAPRLTVVAGARVDDDRQFGTFGTYRVGVNYLTAFGARLRGDVGSAFRAPTFYENFSTGYVTGNPHLRPEHAESWEIGAEQALLGGRVTLGVTAFAQTFRDMIDYTGDTTACGFSYCNVARARAAGLEYEARAFFPDGVSAAFGFTHLDTRVLTAGFDTTSGGLYHLGQPLIRRPATSWNAALSKETATRGAVDLRLSYVGRRADRDFRTYPAQPVTLSGYLLVDLGATYPIAARAGRGRVAVTLRIQNLTDTHYQSIFNFLSPGRMVLLGVRAGF